MGIKTLLSALPIVLMLANALPAQAGSVKVKPPTAAEIGQVREQQRTIVLFQASASIDGKRVNASREYDGNKLLRFFVASLDGLEAPSQVFPASLSAAAAEQGWRYLVLPPGLYYLLVLPPGVEQNPPATAYDASAARYGRLTQYEFTPGRGGFYSPELSAFVFRTPPPDFRSLPGFWFQVPADAGIVYLGSLSVACKGGRGLFGSLIDSCGEFESSEDQGAATALAASSLPGLSVQTLALVPLGAKRSGVVVPQPAGLPVTARDKSQVEAAFTGAELTPWATIHGTGQAFALYNLLAVGGELLQQSSSERLAQKRAAALQPCMEKLAAAVAGLDLAAELSSVTLVGLAAIPWYLWLCALPGVALTAYSVYAWLRFSKFGVSELMLTSSIVRLGDRLNATVMIPKMVEGEFKGVLACTHQYTTGSGKHRSTHHDVLWSSELISGGSPAGSEMTHVSFHFELPIASRGAHPTQEKGSTKYYWRLSVTSDMPGVDYKASFDIVVE